MTRPEAVCVAGAGLREPHLRVGVAGQQAIRGGKLVRVHLEVARLDVNDDKLAQVVRPQAGTNGALVDLVATPGELLFAVARSRRRFPPVLNFFLLYKHAIFAGVDPAQV